MGISDFFNKSGKDTRIGKLIQYDKKHYGNPNSTFGQRLGAASIRTAEKLVSINPSSIRYGYYTGRYGRAGAIKEAGSRIASGLFGNTTANIIAPSKEKFDRLHNRGRRRFNGFGNYGNDIEKLKDATFDILDTQKLMSDVLDETYNVLSKTNEVLQDLALTSKKNEQLLQQIIYLRSPGVSKSANISPINSRNPYETKSSEGGMGIKEGVAATTIGALIARFLISPPGLAIIGSALAIGGWTKIFSEVSKYRNRRRSAIDRGENDPAIDERNKLANDVAKSGGWGSSASQNYLKGKSSTGKSNRLPNPTEPIEKNTSITKIDEYIINTSQNITFTSDKFIMFEAKGSDGIRFKSDKIIFDSNDIEFTSNTKISENTPDKISDKSSTTTSTNKTAETGIGHTQPKRLPTDSDSLVGSSVGGWNRNEANARRGSGGRARESGSSGPSSSSSGVSTKYGEKGGPDYSDPFDIGNKSFSSGPLKADNTGKINPVEFSRKMEEKVKNSPLNGQVPTWGAKFGITTGSAKEWSRFFTMIQQQESGHRIAKVNPDGTLQRFSSTPAGEKSFGPGQFNIGEYGLKTWKDVNDPDKVMDAYINVAKQGKLFNYFGSLQRPHETLQHKNWYEKNVAPYLNSKSVPLINDSNVLNNPNVGNLEYNNQEAGRKLPLSSNLEKLIQESAKEAGVNVSVFSGGNVPGKQIGSSRHNQGNAGDVRLFTVDENGKRTYLNYNNPNHLSQYQKFVEAARARGATGIGAGPGYMESSQGPGIHVGYGTEAVWGAGGSGANAPQWVKDAVARGAIRHKTGKIISDKSNVPSMESLPDVEVAKNIVNTPYNAKNNSIVSYSRDLDKQEEAARILEKQRQESYRKSWDNTSPEWNNNPIIPDLVGDRPERQFSAKDQMETQPVVRPSGVEVSGSTQSWNTNDFYTTPSAPEVNSKSDAPPIIKSDTNKDTKAVPDATPF